MITRITRLASKRPFLSAVFVLSTAAVTWLWAHEGHLALPTKGAVVDAARGQVNLSPDARQALDVQVAEAGLDALDERVTAPATLVAPWQRRAYVTTRLAGKIAAVHVQPGETVAQGQTLADVQSLELENLQLELLNAQNDVRLSATNLEQQELASKRGAIPERELYLSRSKHKQNLNDLEIGRLKLIGLGVEAAAVQRLLDDPGAKPFRTLPIKSPIAGVVTHTEVQVGQVVDLPDHLFEVVDLSAVWVKVDVLEKDLYRIEAGQPVELRLAAYPGPENVFHSTVQVKGLSLDPQTQEGAVWAELSNPSGLPPRLLPGMYGQAEITLPAGKKVVTIPAGALIGDGAERYVLVEEGPGQYARQNVVVGRRSGGQVEIREGQLVPGDRVVTVGSHELASFFEQEVLRLSPEAAKNIGLRVEPAARRPVAQVVQLGGVVDLPPGRRGIASSRLAGTVRRILVDQDQVVKAGEVVAEVTSVEFQNLQVELLRNHLQARLLEESLERLRPLAENAALPARQLRETESAFRAALQRRDSFRRKLEAAGLSAEQVQELLDRQKFVETLPVRSPITGAVVRFHVALGHAVKAEDPLFDIHDVARPVVRGFVSEQQLSRVRIGQKARVRLLADDKGAVAAEAEVVRSGQVFGTADRTLSVWVELKEPPRVLWLNGMLAQLTLVVDESSPVLAVPREALLRDGAHTYLFVRQADGTFERRPVGIGRSDDQWTVITEGLSEGEMVAVRGVTDLQTAYASVK